MVTFNAEHLSIYPFLHRAFIELIVHQALCYTFKRHMDTPQSLAALSVPQTRRKVQCSGTPFVHELGPAGEARWTGDEGDGWIEN